MKVDIGSRTRRKRPHGLVLSLAGVFLGAVLLMRATAAWGWGTFAANPQHTGVASVAAQPLQVIRWSTPVDLSPPSGDILIHYGSPLVTPANSVILPMKTATGGYKVEARSASDGSLIWSQTTDYILPPRGWTPSYSPTLTPGDRLYFPGAGGTVYFRDGVDSSGPATNGQLAFFGTSNYLADPASFNSTVFVNTPITSDNAGNIYFGFRTSGTAPLSLRSGIARIDTAGNGTWISAVSASGGDTDITRVPHQAAPALSNDEQTLYAAVASDGAATNHYLVGLDSTTLALRESSPGVKMRVALRDPRNAGINPASVSDNSSASPMVGPDGDVYYGVLGNPFNGSRGWMLHFSSDLGQTKTPGAFGWDSTASVVQPSAVPSYTGNSSYLIFAKHNNYAGADGGDGVNKLSVLDPNDTMVEPHASSNGQLVMKEVVTIAGLTPDPEFTAQFPSAVREWCINSAVVDPFTRSVMANSEDGRLYRWDLTTNTFAEAITLSPGVGEAYTPTLIGPDGTVYAINWAILNAVGAGPTPSPTTSPTPSLTPPNLPTPTTGPVAQWRFEESAGTFVGDSSGAGNHGSAENGMGRGAGAVGVGGVFDGVNDRVRIANNPSLNLTGTALSLEAWVKPTAINGYHVLIHKEMQYSLAISNGQLTYADSVTWSYAAIGAYGSIPAGVWSHVAATFDGSVIRLYVNGSEIGNKVRAGSLTATANQVSLASYNFIAFPFAGTLDEVAVYGRALSAAEVQAHFAAVPPLPTATATITATSSRTPSPTAPVPPTATWTLPPPATSTRTETPTPTFTVPGAATATIGPATPTPAGGPVGQWRFEDGAGTFVGDSSGFGNNGTVENGMGWGAGVVGGGGVFDGVNDRARIANSTSLNIAGTGLTLEAWVKPTAINGYRVLIHKELQYSLAISNGQLTYADSVTWSYAAIGAYGSIPAGVWSHVAATFDGSVIRLYVNGSEVGNKVRAGSLTATTNQVSLASYNFIAFPFAGTLDEVAIYGRRLSAAEVLAHFNSAGGPPITSTPTRTATRTPTVAPTQTPPMTPTSTPSATAASAASPTPGGTVGQWRFDQSAGTLVGDSSGLGNNGTAENGMAWGAGQVGSAGVFDGINDQVRVTNSASVNVTGSGLTLEAWVKPTAIGSYRVLIHKEQQYSLAIADGKLTYADSITWSYATIGAYGSVPVGVWSHVAVTFDGGVVRFYVNGAQVGSLNRAGSLAATTNPVCLGAYNCAAFHVSGSLDEAAVYRRALSAAEVLARFHATGGLP